MNQIDKKARIAIIGAGASGLSAAWNLKKKGYTNITIFEKEARVGGKTYSYNYKDHIFEIGSVIFTKEYKTLIKLASELNIPCDKFSLGEKNLLIDGAPNGQISPLDFLWNYNSYPKIINAVLHFLKMKIQYKKLQQPGYQKMYPELFINFETFIKKHKIKPITSIVEPYITGWGYGYFSEVPAMYYVKFIVPLVKNTQFFYFSKGWQNFWEKIADHFTVKKNAVISGIKRHIKEDGTEIQLTVNGKTEIFDKIIITSPLNKLNKYMDLSPTEKNLFSKVKSYRYITTLVEGEISTPLIYIMDNIKASKIGHVMAIAKYNPDTKIFTTYQMVSQDWTSDKINQTLKEDLEKAGCTIKKIVKQQEWEFFYHVKTEDLQEGFYEKINALQGEKNTYYLGSIFNFECVEHCASFSEYITNKFF